MTYWLDLFTGQTWQEFRDYGGSVSGFRKRMRNAVNRIKPGDVLLCYLTGVMRWVGALEVHGPSRDKKMIWEFDEFPERSALSRSCYSSRNKESQWSNWKAKWISIGHVRIAQASTGFYE